MLYADGKVVTPLFRAQPGDTRVDKTTGEIRPVRAEPDAGLHFEGTGETAWGTKFVLVAVRTDRRPRPDHPRRRLGPHPRRRSRDRHGLLHPTSHRCAPARKASSTTPPSAASTTRRLLRDLGLAPRQPGHRRRRPAPRQPRRKDGRRVEKTTHVEDRDHHAPRRHRPRRSHLYARGGAIGIGDARPTPATCTSPSSPASAPTATPTRTAVPLVQRLPAPRPPRRRHHHRPAPRQRRRRAPEVQPHRERPAHPADRPRLHRASTGDATTPRSINRALDDTLWLRRAHSRRPRTPAPQPARLRAHGQRPRPPPPRQTRRTLGPPPDSRDTADVPFGAREQDPKPDQVSSASSGVV